MLNIEWRESGVQLLENSDVRYRRGQGRELIEEALPYQLGAKTCYVLGVDGVHCTIALPIEHQR